MQPGSWRLIAVLLLALGGSLAWAGNTPFVITPESRPRGLVLSPAEGVFEDETAKLTVDQVRVLPPDRFLPPQKFGELRFDSAYWVRVAVRSELNVDMPYTVSVDWWDQQDIHVLRADGSDMLLRGGLLKEPRDDKDKFYPTFLIHPGETVTLLVRLKSTGMFHTPDSFDLVLSQAASRFESSLPYFYFDGIVFGILFGLSLYNLGVAWSTRDRAYLLYSIYLLAIAVSLMGLMSPSASKLNQFFLTNHPWVAAWMKRLADPIAWIVLLLFSRDFLETRRHLPVLDKLFLILAVTLGIEFVMFVFGWAMAFERHFPWLSAAPNHFVAIIGVVAGVLRYRQGFVPAKYFVAAQALLSLGLLLRVYEDIGWNALDFLPNSPFWNYIKFNQLWVGAAAEAILFSMGLSHRINVLRQTVARQALEAEQERRRTAIENSERLEVEVAERTQELRVEKENASRLLHNILPEDIATELIANGSTQPQRYEEVSVLFTDFLGFTNAVASLPAKKVVEELNDIFQHFDDIIDACGIEKIKTIGDSYMIVGGLPKPLPDHAERCVDAAFSMLAYLDERNRNSALKWQMRAGIHSGAVIAGVVGKRKFTYDVWGDTVNIANRMESAAEAGRVNVSAYTYDLIKSRYKAEYRGKLDAKGKGQIDMYFVLP